MVVATMLNYSIHVVDQQPKHFTGGTPPWNPQQQDITHVPNFVSDPNFAGQSM